jgi:hypothetical protein
MFVMGIISSLGQLTPGTAPRSLIAKRRRRAAETSSIDMQWSHDSAIVCVYASDRHAATDICMQTECQPPPPPPGGAGGAGAAAPLLGFVHARWSATDCIRPADCRFSARYHTAMTITTRGTAAPGPPAISLAPMIEDSDAAAACRNSS